MRKSIALAVFAAALMPVAASAEFDNSIPVRFFSAQSPIALTESSIFFPQPPNGTVRACLSFRNVTAKPAAAVRFTFEFDDLFNHPLREAILDRSGSFGPGIAIEGKMSELGGNSDSFKNCVNVQGTSVKPSLEKIEVTEVRFEDGTTWSKGGPVTRVFDAQGNRLVTPVVVGGGTPATTGGSGDTKVTIGGATAVAGTVGPAGSLFGTIAWVAGSRSAYGVAVDAQTQDEADFAAMTACTQLNHGNPGCKPVARMTGSDKKCAAIATDEHKTAVGEGPDLSSTIQSVLAALAKAGGTIEGNSVVASKCNSH